MKRRQKKLLAADRVHLFTQDLHDLERDSLAQRQKRVDAGGKLANETCAQQEFVRNDLGVSRVFTESGDKES